VSVATSTPTRPEYQIAFETERDQSYPVMDALVARYGYQVTRGHFDEAARVLACPVKKNPPCWQHGRLLYAVARHRLANLTHDPIAILDVGTAKGFSALCLHWALIDSGRSGRVASVDVIEPYARVRRNTVAEVDGYKTLREILEPWHESLSIDFRCMTGIEWLKEKPFRVEVAFIDGKHTGKVVAEEGKLLARRQSPGDVVVFDDVHLEDVNEAVLSLGKYYELERVQLLPHRAYAIGVRRG
jgi:predicted O-methyltransferase YrrM